VSIGIATFVVQQTFLCRYYLFDQLIPQRSMLARVERSQMSKSFAGRIANNVLIVFVTLDAKKLIPISRLLVGTDVEPIVVWVEFRLRIGRLVHHYLLPSTIIGKENQPDLFRGIGRTLHDRPDR